MGSRLAGKRVIVTDCDEYNGADIVELFKEEGATVFADDRDLTVHTAADDLIREVGHVDILIANLATKFEFAQARDQPDNEMERLMNSIFYPLHRLTRAVLPQMLESQGTKGRCCALRSGARCSVRLHEKSCSGSRAAHPGERHRSDICRQPNVLAARLPRDGRVQAKARRGSRRPTRNRARAGSVGIVFGRTRKRLSLRSDSAVCRRMDRVLSPAAGSYGNEGPKELAKSVVLVSYPLRARSCCLILSGPARTPGAC